MTPDTSILTSWFRTFNVAYFGGRLPEPRIVTTNSRTILGQFRCHRRRLRWLGTRSGLTDLTIKISTYYDAAERDYQNTLLHEMIHLAIACGGRRDTSPHGRLFRAEMDRLNSGYGWSIRVSTPTKTWPVAERNRKQRSHCILMLTMADGRRFVSVVNPAYAERIDRMAGRAPGIRSHAWYTSHDDYFARFPKVRSLRGRCLKAGEAGRLMAMMTPAAAGSEDKD